MFFVDFNFVPFFVSPFFRNSVTVPGYQGNLQAAITHSAGLAAWERFCVECILTFIVVLVFYMSTDSYKSYFGVSALSIGAAYSACSFVSVSFRIAIRWKIRGRSFTVHFWFAKTYNSISFESMAICSERIART